MNDAAVQLEFETISILLFSAGGVRFGVDSAQIVAIDPDGTNVEDEPIRLDALLKVANATDCAANVTLQFRHDRVNSTLLAVNAVEDIVEIKLSDIQLLPHVIADRLLYKGIWGVVPYDDTMMILLDVDRLLKNINMNAFEETPGSLHIQESQGDTV